MTRFLRPALAQSDTRSVRPAPKQRASIYGTAEHQEWRAAVVHRAAGICQGKGCCRSGVRLFADHIVELRDGGSPYDLTNGQALCGACHSRKTAAARAARQQGGGGGQSLGGGGQ